MTNEYPNQEAGAAAPHFHGQQTVEHPKDALVSFQVGLIFVTTGQVACDELGADLDQVALTPNVAWRIAEVLRETLQHSGMHERRTVVGAWSGHEARAMPHGVVVLHDRFVKVGIEPLGAGARVTVAWDHVPGLIVALEAACDWAQSPS